MTRETTITTKAADKTVGLTPSELADFLSDIERAGSNNTTALKARLSFAGRIKEITATVIQANQ